jgi:hypothetical protein
VEDWLQQNGVWAKLDATLRPVLVQLWEQGYTQGLMLNGKRIAAWAVTANVAALMGGWLMQIIRTTISLIAKALISGLAIPGYLADESRAEMIAVTEVNRAIQQANADSLNEEGVTLVRWVTGGPDPCKFCIANEAEGPHPLGVPFSSGALVPPQHPNCRCSIEKA